MLQRCSKKMALCGLVLGLLTALAPCQPAKAEASPLVADGSCPQCTKVTGIVDRISASEIVIGDSLYRFAPDSNPGRGHFSRGQLVTGELDGQKIIRSLRRLTPEKTANVPGAPVVAQPDGKQPLRLEGGVWKN